MPTKVIEAREDGLAIRLRGPFRHPDLIPWGNIVDIEPGEILDEGDVLVLLQIELSRRGSCPSTPGGRAGWRRARWACSPKTGP